MLENRRFSSLFAVGAWCDVGRCTARVNVPQCLLVLGFGSRISISRELRDICAVCDDCLWEIRARCGRPLRLIFRQMTSLWAVLSAEGSSANALVGGLQQVHAAGARFEVGEPPELFRTVRMTLTKSTFIGS